MNLYNKVLDMVDWDAVVEDASEKAFYQNLAQKIMRRLQFGFRVTLYDILVLEGGSSRRILRLLHEMVKKDVIAFRDGYFFLPAHERGEIVVHLCSECAGRGIALNSRIWRSLVEFLQPIWKRRPYPTFLFDQRPVTLESSIFRAAYIYLRGDVDLYNSSIAILGDDDLSSLVLAFLSRIIGVDKLKITVFEIDRRLISFLSDIANYYGFDNLEFVEIDIFDHLAPPHRYQQSFQIILMDPTPSFEATRAFLEYGIALLYPQPGHVIYLSANAPAYQDFLALQSFIVERNLLITEIIPSFIHYTLLPDVLSETDRNLYKIYHQDATIAFVESLIRLELTANTRSVVPQKIRPGSVLGKATRRVLDDLERDPAYHHEPENRSYFQKVARKLRFKEE